ncbi:putative reverse transcriptase domain-containing protein [Tanacetum coccineum]|uniref:Reverse transcriptase domain-containing protein n=1 Tax=Tanacetum coccineum TaxID=301880 RepID=A0ABQ5BSB8_9ASTR
MIEESKYEFGKEQEEAFQTLKDNLCNAPILSLLEGSKDFVVYCDASNQVVFALKIWRHYLYGTKSIIYMEHKSLQNIFDQKELDMRQRRWIELFSDYDYEIRYHLGKANVVADAFSRKERVKPRRVRAMSMTILSSVTDKILAAQGEASKIGNATAKMLHGLDQQMEKKEDGGADKKYYDLGDMHWWPCIKKDIDTYVSDCLTYSKVKAETSKTFGYTRRLQDEKLARIYIDKKVARHGVPVSIISDRDGRSTSRLKAARDHQKSYADNRRKPLEFEVGDQVLLKVSPWKGVLCFVTKGKLAPRYVGPFEILERIGPVAYRLRLSQELSSVHDTFHVSNLKKWLADANLYAPLEEIKVDKTLCFVEEPVEIMDHEVKKFKCSRILNVKVHWNSNRGPEFT